MDDGDSSVQGSALNPSRRALGTAQCRGVQGCRAIPRGGEEGLAAPGTTAGGSVALAERGWREPRYINQGSTESELTTDSPLNVSLRWEKGLLSRSGFQNLGRKLRNRRMLRKGA